MPRAERILGQTGAVHRFGDLDFAGKFTSGDIQRFNLYHDTALPRLPEPGTFGTAGLLTRKNRP